MIGKRDVGLIFVGWTILAIAAGMQAAIYVVSGGHAARWPTAFRDSFIDWYLCAIFTPVFVFMVSRWPLGKGKHWRIWTGYVTLVALCTVLKFALAVLIARAIYPGAKTSIQESLSGDFVFQFFAFMAVVGVLLALVYYRSFRDRETRAAQLEATLSRAQLDALRVQLHPHFLFNTLNSIATLIHIDPDAADEMLGRLAELLRVTLERGDVQEVALDDELKTLDRYVEIMRVRFRDRLSVDIAVSSQAQNCMVPHFILQPLLENAIEHGVDRVLGKCTVRLRGDVSAGVLSLTVSDHGPGLPGGRPADGIGLSNTRRRLSALYGDTAALQIESGESGGLSATLKIPARVLERL